jgi:IPT/TIG domain
MGMKLAGFYWLVLIAGIFLGACIEVRAQQALLQITSPAPPNNIFNPGQTITIVVSADRSVPSQSIWINEDYPLPDAQPTSTPNQFTIALPATMPPGVFPIIAEGATSPGNLVNSVPVAIDVERPDLPTNFIAAPLNMVFSSVGETGSIDAQATFSDGSIFGVTRSTRVLFASNDTQIATVDSKGIVTAIAPGQTYIVVSYASALYAPVIVQVPQPAPSGPAPVITNVSPTSGTPGVTPVTVSGSGFGSSQGKGTIAIGTTSGGPIIRWNDTQIVATVPVGSYPGVVQVAQNGQYSNEVPFTTLVPTVTSVNPQSGSQGTPVTIGGSNFGATQGLSTLAFNRGLASPSTWTDTLIVTQVPAAATTGDLIIVVNDVASDPVTFTAPPVIAGVSPGAGRIGDSVTISGSNYGVGGDASAGPTVVINGAVAAPTTWGPASISTTVPSGAASGSGLVTVSVNNVISNSVPFTVLPLITGLQPTSVQMGTTVDIFGSNLGDGTSPGTATLNGMPVSIQFWSLTLGPRGFGLFGQVVVPIK